MLPLSDVDVRLQIIWEPLTNSRPPPIGFPRLDWGALERERGWMLERALALVPVLVSALGDHVTRLVRKAEHDAVYCRMLAIFVATYEVRACLSARHVLRGAKPSVSVFTRDLTGATFYPSIPKPFCRTHDVADDVAFLWQERTLQVLKYKAKRQASEAQAQRLQEELRKDDSELLKGKTSKAIKQMRTLAKQQLAAQQQQQQQQQQAQADGEATGGKAKSKRKGKDKGRRGGRGRGPADSDMGEGGSVDAMGVDEALELLGLPENTPQAIVDKAARAWIKVYSPGMSWFQSWLLDGRTV
jgi:hypothetical protein